MSDVLLEVKRPADLRLRDIERRERPVLRWATEAMIHATEADVPSYDAAAAFATQRRRFLLIESETRHAGAWCDVIRPRRIPTLTLLPRHGLHPIAPKKEGLH